MTTPILRFDLLTGGYGTIPIIHDVSGAVGHGHCLCVLGRNGVGKSTLLKILSGHLPVMSGSISLNGQDVSRKPPEQRFALGISAVPQERPVFDGLTVLDNLTLMETDRRIDGFKPFFDAFPILGSRLNQLAGTLSGGERKILSFVRALKDGAPLTLLDEPSEGIQQENIDHMARIIRAAKARGQAFLVVEQHLHLAEAIADAYQVIDNGRVAAEGAASSFTREDLMRRIAV